METMKHGMTQAELAKFFVFRICRFNTLCTVGRLGREGMKSSALDEDLANQHTLVVEEQFEFAEATDMENALQEAVDCLVTEVWYKVLQASHVDTGFSIEEAIGLVEISYGSDFHKSKAWQNLQWFARLGCNVVEAVCRVLDNNDAKFFGHSTDMSPDSTVEYYHEQGIQTEAVTVDFHSGLKGVFRVPDGKLMKPLGMRINEKHGEGLRLYDLIPYEVRIIKLLPTDEAIIR